MIDHGKRHELTIDKIGEVLEGLFGQGGRWKLVVNIVRDDLISQGGGYDQMVEYSAIPLSLLC
jgi:hypothetical protein